MTSDPLDTAFIEDGCFDDLFSMRTQFLDDLEIALEANNIDTLLDMFEENQKNDDYDDDYVTLGDIVSGHAVDPMAVKAGNGVKGNAGCSGGDDNKAVDTIRIVMSPKVRKSKTNRSSAYATGKRKGVSLLAKPTRSPPKQRSILCVNNDTHLNSLSSPSLQEHDYCMSTTTGAADNTRLYNKLPQYLTQLSDVCEEQSVANWCPTSDTFDKIPNYMKGFLNCDDNSDAVGSDENIFIESIEAYIEMADIFIDNEIQDLDLGSELFSEENHETKEDNNFVTNTNYSSEESPKDSKQMHNILDENQFKHQNEEQNDYQNNVNYSNSDDNRHTGGRQSRSRSREPVVHNNSKYSSTRSRRVSTRSSVDSSSDCETSSSRSSSCSSCSSSDSQTSGHSNDTDVTFKLTNSIRRNERNDSTGGRKRLSESEMNYRSKIRPNFRPNSYSNNDGVNRVAKSGRTLVPKTAIKDIDDRKIVYVGNIPDGTTKTDVRLWFARFGAIKEVSVHLRDSGHNYAFVTFFSRKDAYRAVERANDDSGHPAFELSFGGRRQFCRTRYEDLDDTENRSLSAGDMDFDALLRSTQAKVGR